MTRLLLILFVLISFSSRAQLTTAKYRDSIYIKIGLVNAPGTITRLTMAKCWLYLADISDSATAKTKRYIDSAIATVHFDTTSIYAQLDLKVKYTDTLAMLLPYMHKADTPAMLSPYLRTATANATYLIKGGQVSGAQLQYGTTDSVGLTSLVYGNVQDSISATNGVHYMKGKYNSETVLIIKNKAIRNGADQTQSLMFGIGNGGSISANVPFIQWGTSLSSTNQTIASGLFQANSINFRSASSSATPMVIFGAGGPTTTNISANSFTLGTYAGGGAVTNTSGVLNILGLGAVSGASASFAPTTGPGERYAVNDIGTINQTGSASGITGSYTNKSITLTATADYRAFYATNNVGFQFYAGGTAPSAFTSRLLVGTATDNTTDALQINGDMILKTAGNKIKIPSGTNSISGTVSLSGGTATVNTTSVAANSIIHLTLQSCSSCGTIYISAKTASTSFVITSSNASDASTVGYLIINQ